MLSCPEKVIFFLNVLYCKASLNKENTLLPYNKKWKITFRCATDWNILKYLPSAAATADNAQALGKDFAVNSSWIEKKKLKLNHFGQKNRLNFVWSTEKILIDLKRSESAGIGMWCIALSNALNWTIWSGDRGILPRGLAPKIKKSNSFFRFKSYLDFT